MNRNALLIACMLPLAACNSDPEVNARNASVEEVADQLADAGGSSGFVRPGKWQSRVTFEEFNMPGAPPAAASVMRSMNENSQAQESCLTPEEAKRPKEDFFAGAGKNCRYDRFTMGNGKIDAVLKCSDQGMAQTMTMTGTYSPDTYRMQMGIKADPSGGPAGAMTMKMRVDAKRVGECTGDKA